MNPKFELLQIIIKKRRSFYQLLLKQLTILKKAIHK